MFQTGIYRIIPLWLKADKNQRPKPNGYLWEGSGLGGWRESFKMFFYWVLPQEIVIFGGRSILQRIEGWMKYLGEGKEGEWIYIRIHTQYIHNWNLWIGKPKEQNSLRYNSRKLYWNKRLKNYCFCRSKLVEMDNFMWFNLIYTSLVCCFNFLYWESVYVEFF